MKKEEKEIQKYKIKKNNYLGLIFLAIVLISLAYILNHDDNISLNIEDKTKEITVIEAPEEITEETDEIKELMKYVNKGDSNVFKSYESMYSNEEINTNSLDVETMLYIAYKYIETNTDFLPYTKYLTCDIAKNINMSTKFSQCDQVGTSITDYKVNSYITKELLTETVKKIFNINLNTYTNFYTEKDDICYYINNEFTCIINNNSQNISNNTRVETTFIKATKKNNKIEVIEKYAYIKDGIYYNSFESDEVGEGTYITTFTKINGKYYWTSTAPYEEN